MDIHPFRKEAAWTEIEWIATLILLDARTIILDATAYLLTFATEIRSIKYNQGNQGLQR